MNTHNPPTEGNFNQHGNLAGDVIALMRDLLRWQEQIERALRDLDGMYSFNDIVASVLRQERHFYDFGDCCVIMQYEKYPGYSIYHCFIACGKFEAILASEVGISEVAKKLGCKYLSIAGRVGWPRKLKQHGWTHKLSVLHKEVY
jgi:hypothetical protein